MVIYTVNDGIVDICGELKGSIAVAYITYVKNGQTPYDLWFKKTTDLTVIYMDSKLYVTYGGEKIHTCCSTYDIKTLRDAIECAYRVFVNIKNDLEETIVALENKSKNNEGTQ